MIRHVFAINLPKNNIIFLKGAFYIQYNVVCGWNKGKILIVV